MDTKVKHSLKNPKEKSNFLSLLVFGWLAPIFWKGARGNLNLRDIYDPLKSDESERLGDRLEREWNKELRKSNRELELSKNGKEIRKPNLLWALTRMFWAPFMVQGSLLLIQAVVLKVLQPVLQGWIISYFNPGKNTMTQDQVLINAGLMIIVTFLIVLIYHHTDLRCQQIGMCVRVACCSLIYRKILKLNQASLNNTAAGKVANLISNDVARFDTALVYLHYIWIMPIQVAMIAYVMWDCVGAASFAGIGALLIQSVPLQGYLSKLSARLRSEIAVKTDHRVQLMSEMISGIQVIKMYSWEKPFKVIVSEVRKLEMKFISMSSYLKALCVSINVFSERSTLYLTLIPFVLMGNNLTGDIAYALATLFNILQGTCAGFFPSAIFMASETAVSLERLTEFLLLDEVECTEKLAPTEKDGLQEMKKSIIDPQFKHGVCIEMVDVSANWVYGQLPPTLYNISMEVESRSLCAIVGPVGSGKSSLLNLLLGELTAGDEQPKLFTGEDSQTKITSGDIRISYTSQDPWLFSGSVRDNILFGEPFYEGRYKEVTRVCALHKDFEQLPEGDLTFVGERGASLSGGQRARVNLARAVYRDADLYLLDDPLSAVDARVGRHLFEECITGFLKGKTRILVTHQLQFLRQTNTVVVLNHGTVESQATYKKLADQNFHFLDSVEDEEPDKAECPDKDHENDVEYKNTAVPADGDKEPSQVSENSKGCADISEEEMATGEMSNDVYWGYFLASGNLYSLAIVAIVFIAAQITANGTDYWLTYWTNQEILRATLQLKQSATKNTSLHNYTESNHQEIGSQWLDEYGLVRSIPAIYVYTICILCCIVMIILRNMLLMRICMNANRNIHNSMFTNLLRATMRFFNTNPSGRILNRFSKDVGAMDELLPKVMMDALQIFIIMIGILVMVAVVNNWMIIPIIAMSVVFYFFKVYYIRTAQTLKRLESIAKSPVFSDVSSTLDGLTTIRSRGSPIKVLLRQEFDHHQDTHTGAWYLTIATATAFGFILDLISCAFVACVTFSFILMNDEHILGGSVGLAISQSLILTGMVQHGMKQATEVIAQMTSVERVLQYTNLPGEGPFTTENPPPPTWPPKGALVFKNVSMRYADDKPPILKSLNLDIKAGWKVGIVGRTGAGKSSLISALFRLTGDRLEGEIVLDGIDTKSIGLHELRRYISIIPQEPILFSASLRHNLDPFEQYSDAELWNSLREVELDDAVPSLDFRVAGGGANFSVGQRQLICLARATLRNNRLLVLDEATANVDRRTDALIQSTIRRRFADCTVLTIAHRLNTIMDSDRILLMAGGHAVEFGHPHLLLKNHDGHFYEMLQQTGKAMAEKLAAIAERSFLLSPEFREESKEGTVTCCTSDQITRL